VNVLIEKHKMYTWLYPQVFAIELHYLSLRFDLTIVR